MMPARNSTVTWRSSTTSWMKPSRVRTRFLLPLQRLRQRASDCPCCIQAFFGSYPLLQGEYPIASCGDLGKLQLWQNKWPSQEMGQKEESYDQTHFICFSRNCFVAGFFHGLSDGSRSWGGY